MTMPYDDKKQAKRAWVKPSVKSVTPVRETRGGLLPLAQEKPPVYFLS